MAFVKFHPLLYENGMVCKSLQACYIWGKHGVKPALWTGIFVDGMGNVEHINKQYCEFNNSIKVVLQQLLLRCWSWIGGEKDSKEGFHGKHYLQNRVVLLLFGS